MIKTKAELLAFRTNAEIDKVTQLEFGTFPFDDEAFQAFKEILPQAKSLEIFDLSKNKLSAKMAEEITDLMQDCFSIKGAALLPVEAYREDLSVKLKPQTRLGNFCDELKKINEGVSKYFRAFNHSSLPHGVAKLFYIFERNAEVAKILNADAAQEEPDSALRRYITALTIQEAQGSLTGEIYEKLDAEYKAAKKGTKKEAAADDEIQLDEEEETDYKEARSPNTVIPVGSAAALHQQQSHSIA